MPRLGLAFEPAGDKTLAPPDLSPLECVVFGVLLTLDGDGKPPPKRLARDSDVGIPWNRCDGPDLAFQLWLSSGPNEGFGQAIGPKMFSGQQFSMMAYAVARHGVS